MNNTQATNPQIYLIAATLLKFVLETKPETILVGGELRAIDLARLALHVLPVCPKCSTPEWQNASECLLCSLSLNIKGIEEQLANDKKEPT